MGRKMAKKLLLSGRVGIKIDKKPLLFSRLGRKIAQKLLLSGRVGSEIAQKLLLFRRVGRKIDKKLLLLGRFLEIILTGFRNLSGLNGFRPPRDWRFLDVGTRIHTI